MPRRPPLTSLISSWLCLARLSVERRAVQRSVRALKRHEKRMRKRQSEIGKARKALARTEERIAADLAHWRADKRATEEAIEMLERKLSVLELVNETLVVEHGKLVEMHKAETAVHVMRHTAALPKEEA